MEPGACNRRQHLAWWDEQLRVKTLRDLAQHSRTIDQALRRLTDQQKSPKTRAAYVESLRAFCIWCVQRGFLTTDPTQYLPRLHTTPQTQRRAFTVEEINRILSICPTERQLLYETALYTGQRARELQRLTIFHLDRTRGGLRLDAAWTKNRKTGFQLLPAYLVSALAEFADRREAQQLYSKAYARGKHPYHAEALPLLYVPSHTALALDRDLQRAGIPKHTHEGKIDFHCWRVTYASLLDGQGASAKDTQELLRHATPILTMNRYVKRRRDKEDYSNR